MEEHVFSQVVGSVLIYDTTTRQWLPAGTSSGLSMVRLVYCASNNTYRIHCQKIDGAKEVVLDNVITADDKFNLANESFVRWHDRHTFWGFNFRPQRGSREGPNGADIFFEAIKEILSKIVNQSSSQNQLIQQQQQPNMTGDALVSNQQPLQPQNSASVIQRPIQTQQQISHQQAQQQAVHQTLMHQQQAQMMNMRMMNEQHLPQAAANLLSQATPAQILQQQQQHQSNQPIMQQHQQYMQQQPTQSHPNHNQINLYQQTHQQHMTQPYSAQHIRQPPPQPQMQQQQQSQPAQVVAAPIPPPPPPPPPPAPPIAGLNNGRVNGTSNNSSNNSMSNNNNVDAQHSPIANNNASDRNGGSPNQQTSTLANELAKCQLKKVNLSRSDSEKESECNNNIGQAKTTRASSVAYVTDSLMSDLNKKIASRREKLDQEGNTQSNCSTNSMSNGTSFDKGQESWLADLIRKEICKEMSKMKAEIIEVIKSELKQR